MNKSLVFVHSTQSWDPNGKERWFSELEKEPVNDEKWSCIVTTAVPYEARDEEYIEIYAEYVAGGMRKSVKIISASDVVKVLKESTTGGNKTKQESRKTKTEKQARKARGSSYSRFAHFLELAAKHAVLNDHEFKLQPELMAGVLKCIILNVKEEHQHQKKVDAVRDRKVRNRNIKAKFIKDMKPFEVSQKEVGDGQTFQSVQVQNETIRDEPIDGPDLYILLVNFYDLMCYPEFQKMNIPFRAILKITNPLNIKASNTTMEVTDKRQILITSFWESLKQNCEVWEKTDLFKDIAVIEYKTPLNISEPDIYGRTIFNEITWMQYSAHQIHRQHQKYLEQLQVQRLIVSLEPLDLSKCTVYNKMCDALITGEPLTPLLVLHSMIEQVVAGVPETESEASEYKPKKKPSRVKEGGERAVEVLMTPCLDCRAKSYGIICNEAKKNLQENPSQDLSEEDDWTGASEENSENSTSPQTLREELEESSKDVGSQSLEISESLLTSVAKERRLSRQAQSNKNWKTPKICFYGDSIFLQTYFCDPRIIDQSIICDRFFKNSYISKIWEKYPELPPEDRAFFNFHFYTFWKISNQAEDKIKLKILFVLSMKLIEVIKSYIHREDSNAPSEMIGKPSKYSRVKFNESIEMKEGQFSKYFFKNLIADFAKKKPTPQKIKEKYGESIIRAATSKNVESMSDQRLKRHEAMCSLNVLRSAENQEQTYLKNSENLMTFYSFLDCLEISSLTETSFLSDKTNHFNFVRNFKFYENLSPNLMVQRLVEAVEDYNTILTNYFAPTDTLILSMYNDSDYRGIFYSNSTAALLTPVTLRDFYKYVYPTIGDWLVEDYEEFIRCTTALKEKRNAKEEKKDAEYLKQLKQEYCSMSEEQRKEFLNAEVSKVEPEVQESELSELPTKAPPQHPEKVAFIATNYSDLRVENTKDVHEFYSEDGTKVAITIDSWLYSPTKILNLTVKRSALLFNYNQILGQEDVSLSFTFRTNNDIIFRFNKDTNIEWFKYNLTISWPIGLLIHPINLGTCFYIRQSYLTPYPEGWEIEDEVSRCFLQNGSVVIFKKGGGYDILSGSGTKYIFKETLPKCEIVSTTGEVWVTSTKGPCRYRKKLLTRYKIFIGYDPKAQETFYKREDGTSCMLWSCGKLVTRYPDGTKITSVPDFAEEEVTTDWTEEEKSYFGELDTKYQSEPSVPELRSRTILRNSSSTPKTVETDKKSFTITGFVLVTCTYLMEHPKYAKVSYDPQAKITLPEQLCVVVNPNGSYEVQQGRNFLSVNGSKVEFYAYCGECKEKTTAVFHFNSSDILCKVTDFFQNALFVYRSGKIRFLQRYQENNYGETEDEEILKSSRKNGCPRHAINQALKQRCFAFERDLSGVEFIHGDTLAYYFHQLPDNTYFEFDTADPNDISHTFVSSYYKTGYEKWEMSYERKDDFLPTNLKKKDMKELGAKQVNKNLFKYPFPEHHNRGNKQKKEYRNRNVEMPKIIVSRTVRCISQEPDSVLEEIQKYVAEYQKRAQNIFIRYKNHSSLGNWSEDSWYLKTRLTKIALTQSQSLQMYPHLCHNSPSTEKDIHYFGHFINLMEEVKNQVHQPTDILSDCKQTPNRLPRSSNFDTLYEENEST